jgi:hypothetical protein
MLVVSASIKSLLFYTGFVGWNGAEFQSGISVPDGMCGYPVAANSANRYVGMGVNGTKDTHALQQYNVLEKNANLRQVLNAPLQMAAAGGQVIQPCNRVPFSAGSQMIRIQTAEGTNMRLPPTYSQYRFRNLSTCVPAGTNLIHPADIPHGVRRPNMPQTSSVGRFINQPLPGSRTTGVNGCTDNYIPQRNGFCTNTVMMGQVGGTGYMQHPSAGWNQMQNMSGVPVQQNVASPASSGFISNVNNVSHERTLMSPQDGLLPSVPIMVSKLNFS